MIKKPPVVPEPKMEPLLSYPYNAFLMLRAEFALILKDDLQAKLLRIIEAHIETQRAVLYREAVNKQKSDSNQAIYIPKDIYVPISYKLFMNDLYDLVTSENTIKRALNILVEYKIIFRRYDRKKKYAPPEYSINTGVLQGLLNMLPGYQELIPSILQALRVSNIDTLNSSGYQILTPSGYQFLIPSISNSSSNEKSRVSIPDTNIRKKEDYEGKNEWDPLSFAHSLSSLSLAEQLAHYEAEIARIKQTMATENTTEAEHLSTNVDTPVEKQPETPSLIANTLPVTSQHETEQLTPEEQRIHEYWQKLGFEANINSRLKNHWTKLTKHIGTFEQFKSLFEWTRQQIENDPSLKNKTVSPGNLANDKYLNGWKQKQEPPPDKPGSSQQGKPKSLAELNRQKMQYAGIAASGK